MAPAWIAAAAACEAAAGWHSWLKACITHLLDEVRHQLLHVVAAEYQCSALGQLADRVGSGALRRQHLDCSQLWLVLLQPGVGLHEFLLRGLELLFEVLQLFGRLPLPRFGLGQAVGGCLQASW